MDGIVEIPETSTTSSVTSSSSATPLCLITTENALGRRPTIDMDVTTIELSGAIHSTSAVLFYCSRVILKPYHVLLTMLGWRPISTMDEDHYCVKFSSFLYLIYVVSLTLLGYILQFAACFRRDKASGFHQTQKLQLYKGFWDNALKTRTCNGSVLGLYIFPNFLHLSAFAYTLYRFRICQYEQFHTLVEKAFLQTHLLPTYFSTRPKLERTFLLLLITCVLWLLTSFATQIIHVSSDWPTFTWLEANNDSRLLLLCLMLVTLFWQDLIHITILWCYGIQCQLLIALLRNISDRIRGKINLEDAIKEINEYCKFIKYLNDEMSIPVAILILYSGSLTTSGLLALLMEQDPPNQRELYLVATVLSTLIWAVTFSFPIIQAGRLTSVCQSVCQIGHQMRSRPFGYHDTPREDLDSFLNYTSTLDMKATLFRVPVYSGMVISFLALGIFFIVLLGELSLINLGI